MEDQLHRAVEVLKSGGVVAYPTDTVYGLGADAFNETAVMRIFEIKRRPLSQPLPLLIADEESLSSLVHRMPEMAVRLARRFWPGGLTLVVPKNPSLPGWVTGGGDTVALRIPDHPVTLQLIRGLGAPLVGTSANLSGLPSVTTADAVRAQLGDSVDFILDGGVCPGGIESTVVDVTGDSPRILREGAVSSAEIAHVWGHS